VWLQISPGCIVGPEFAAAQRLHTCSKELRRALRFSSWSDWMRALARKALKSRVSLHCFSSVRAKNSAAV
jgi:hypothetical protein